MEETKPTIKASTQHHLPVADIKDDIVLTKEGGAALVMKASSINFSLLSEREQEAITFAYAALLNSLSFTIQVLIRSQKKDVSTYLKFLSEAESRQSNQRLKNLMSSYRQFVSQIVKKRNVLEKDFYLVIPASPVEIGLSPISVLARILPGNKRGIPFPKDYVVKKAKTVLYPRRDHLIRQVGRLGLKLEQATTEELVRLLYNTYHPEGGKNGDRISQN